MPIVTDLGIHTTELCQDSKKYLSRLLEDRVLVGASIKNPNFILWKELLDIKRDNLGEDLIKYLYSQLQKNAEYTDPFNRERLKQHIVDKLINLECLHREQEYLKSKKQQEELRHQKPALISIGIIIGLAIAFPLILPLLGGAATLVGVTSLAIGATLLCCSIIPAFVGERTIDSEWIAQAQYEKGQFLQKMEKEKIQAKYAKITKTMSKIPISEKKNRYYKNFLDKERLLTIKEVDDENEIQRAQIPVVKKIAANEMHTPTKSLTAEAGTQTTTDNLQKVTNYTFKFFTQVMSQQRNKTITHNYLI